MLVHVKFNQQNIICRLWKRRLWHLHVLVSNAMLDMLSARIHNWYMYVVCSFTYTQTCYFSEKRLMHTAQSFTACSISEIDKSMFVQYTLCMLMFCVRCRRSTLSLYYNERSSLYIFSNARYADGCESSNALIAAQIRENRVMWQ